MNRCILAALLLATCLWGGQALAAGVEDLGRVRVSVSDQGEDARREAFAEAVERVLARLTGRPDVADEEDVSEITESAGRYVQEFRYDEDDDDELRLTARFDTAALRESLVRAEVPVWQQDRPPVLVWLALERGTRRELVGGDQGRDAQEALGEAARQLGIPLLFPLMDLEDQRELRFTDVAGGFEEPVLEASERYDTPLVLAARLQFGSADWRGRWTLYGPEEERTRWDAGGEDVEQVAEDSLARLAEALREEYTLLPDLDTSTELSVRLLGVESLQDLVVAEERLEALGGVREARPERIEGDEVRFRLEVNVAQERVRRGLERDRRFEPVEDSGDDTLPEGDEDGEIGEVVRVRSEPTYRLSR